MELKETISAMTSIDYKERFAAEYYQTKIRYEKLKALNTKIQANKDTGEDFLGFVPNCPPEVLIRQQYQMEELLDTLEERAVIERINLKEYEK